MLNLAILKWITVVFYLVLTGLVPNIQTLNGPNVCMVKQKYNITKLVKYRAPMSIRTYEWCFSMPPRCSKWNTEMKDMTRLETEERIAEVAVCCPGYKMKEVSCVPICPNGKTGFKCTQDCPVNKWGPNCVNICKPCDHGSCSPIDGECDCDVGWKGERCEVIILTSTTKDVLTTTKSIPMTTTPGTKSSETTVVTSTTLQITPASTTDFIPITIKNIKKAPPTTRKHLNDFKNNIQDTTTKYTTSGYYFTESTETMDKGITTKMPVLSRDLTENRLIKLNSVTVMPSAKSSASPQVEYTSSFSNINGSETTVVNYITKNILQEKVDLEKNFVNITKNNKQEFTKANVTTVTESLPKEKFINIVTSETSSKRTLTKLNISEATFNTSAKTNEDIDASTTISSKYNTEKDIEISPTELPKTTTSIDFISKTSQKTTTTTPTDFTTKAVTVPIKLKAKEIWIKPTQKGDSNEVRMRNNFELQKLRSTNKEIYINTTPKTIIVSIIPTSVSYPIFKKIALTSAAFTPTKSNYTNRNFNKSDWEFTEPMPAFPLTTIGTSGTRKEIKPEHITAVMADKENERTSLDLKSVISIAGGVMMAVITVAVVIVMIERCRRPSYEDVRKINDIRMQVMIDSNDRPPPPYVTSIFHTPLPEPPTLEKCHYQPISTLDRNLKQFMRPVVVQAISPVMLENFREILECHYDHLPRRSRDFQPIPIRCSEAPSMDDCCELRPLRDYSVTENEIETMKCEAKLNEIDNTTSEPLYAEIPCWRPPLEHAVETVNLNGESVTEL